MYTNLLHIFLLNNATIQLILLVVFIYRIVLKEFQTYWETWEKKHLVVILILAL